MFDNINLKQKFNYRNILLLFIILLSFYNCKFLDNNIQEKTYDKWSFAVVADPMENGDSFQNALTEIRYMKCNPEPKNDSAEFVLVAGDICPIVDRYKDYKDIFLGDINMKAFFPVKGNHDYYDEINNTYMNDIILPNQSNISVWNRKTVDYYVTWKNIYLIVVDAYSIYGNDGCINSQGREWVRNIIESAPESIKHIFISFHEPAFPRYRHLYNSFNACPSDRNDFWNMLIEHKDKVRAVFVGHTHNYYRMRVNDPTSSCANDTECFPDDDDGIYQIDVGAAGNGERNTIVRVEVNGSKVSFRVIDAPNGANQSFNVIDEWTI